MRIIDKNNDFYDYLQDSTDKLVFDRRGSFLLTKEQFANDISILRHYSKSHYRFVLLQCGATFWLILATITEVSSTDLVKDYKIELLDIWKNYAKTNELLKLSLISFNGYFGMKRFRSKDYDIDLIKSHIHDMRDAVNHNNYSIEKNMSNYIDSYFHKGKLIQERKTIPLLKACGIGNIIDPQEMFCAIEEYFSIEKTNSETTEAKGATDSDKIVMHGFDVKTSFRGKQ